MWSSLVYIAILFISATLWQNKGLPVYMKSTAYFLKSFIPPLVASKSAWVMIKPCSNDPFYIVMGHKFNWNTHQLNRSNYNGADVQLEVTFYCGWPDSLRKPITWKHCRKSYFSAAVTISVVSCSHHNADLNGISNTRFDWHLLFNRK